MFSNRLPPHAEINPLTRARSALETAGVAIADLTESNPTAVGITYPDDLLGMLGADHARRFDRHDRWYHGGDYDRNDDPCHV